MKKPMSLLLAITMLMSIIFMYPVSAAQAAPKIDLKQAIEIAKSAFNIDSTGYEFNSGYNEGQDGIRSWSLNWNSKANNGSGTNVNVDADTGEILNFNQWEPYVQPTSKIPKYTRDAALQLAKELAQKLQPSKFKETKLFEPEMNTYAYYDSYASDTYNFTFMRQVNGIEFSDNGIYVNIDKNTLKLRYFAVNWERGTLPDATKAMTKDAAKKIFEDKLGIELSYYITYTQPNNQPKVILAYNLKNGSRPVDALTGEVLNNTYMGPMYEKAMMAAGSSNAANVNVTPQEQKEIEASSKYLTKEQAIEVVKKYVNIDESKFTLSNSNIYAGYGSENATWSFNWNITNMKEKRYSYISASVDAVTGELKSFYINDSDNEQPKDSKPKYTKEQAREIGEKYLKQINPEKFAASEYRPYLNDYEDNQVKPIVYNFTYVRKVNGIAVPSNTMNVTVNIYTGQVTGYNYNWSSIDFPSAEGAMTLAQAYGKFYAKNDLTLRYVRYYDYNKYGDKPVVRLVYSTQDSNGLMDAKTGAMLDYNGNPIVEKKPAVFSDIKGNKYESDIKLLVDMGIIESTTDKYNPDSVILQKDFIKMLVKASQPIYYPMSSSSQTSEYDYYYDQAIQRKIISAKEKNPDAAITRQDAAKLLVKLLGAGFVADIDGIYINSFKDAADIKAGYAGYAVIASALGIFTADDGNFAPTAQVSRGEAASLLIKALKVDTTPKE